MEVWAEAGLVPQVVQEPGQAWLKFRFDQAAILRHFAT